MQLNLNDNSQNNLDSNKQTNWLIPIGGILIILMLVGGGFAYYYYSKPKTDTLKLDEVQKTATGIELVYIYPGNFMMGSNLSGEGPRRRVEFKDGFWMGKFEITQSQWESVMGTSINQQREKLEKPLPLVGVGPDYPMYFVNLEEANEFINRLNARNDGFVYSLPSEAQWEYAARGRTTESNYGILDDIAWYKKNSGKSTHPVGGKRPNSYGLYDMSGNVFEMCADVGDIFGYGGAPTDGSANTKGDQEMRIVRGGSFEEDEDSMRVTFRVFSTTTTRGETLGFRVVAQKVVQK